MFAEPRFHFFPQFDRILTLAYDNKRIYLRDIDLENVLKDALIVTSPSSTTARRGRALSYAIQSRGNPKDLEFKLESGPAGAKIDPQDGPLSSERAAKFQG